MRPFFICHTRKTKGHALSFDKTMGVTDPIKSFLMADAALAKDRQNKGLVESHGKELMALRNVLVDAGKASKNTGWTGYVQGLVKALDGKRVTA